MVTQIIQRWLKNLPSDWPVIRLVAILALLSTQYSPSVLISVILDTAGR